MIPRSLPLFVTLCALVAMPLLSPTRALADLTVTARENADGSATFSLRGSSTILPDSYASPVAVTNAGYGFAGPTDLRDPIPAVRDVYGNGNPDFSFPIPSGLRLIYDGVPAPVTTFVSIYGNWRLAALQVGDSAGAESTEEIEEGALPTISGAGSVTVPNFPFFALVPGKFRVGASILEEGASESGGDATVFSGPGDLGFTTVYEVIPLDRDPSISGQSPGTIKVASGSKGTGTIQITNTGNVPMVNLALSEGSRDFKLGKPARTSLAPGESTTCPITFSAKKKSSRVKVGITASAPDRRYELPAPLASAEESEVAEAFSPAPFVIPGELVKTAVTVRGEVAAGVRAPRNPVSLLQGKSKDR